MSDNNDDLRDLMIFGFPLRLNDEDEGAPVDFSKYHYSGSTSSSDGYFDDDSSSSSSYSSSGHSSSYSSGKMTLFQKIAGAIVLFFILVWLMEIFLFLHKKYPKPISIRLLLLRVDKYLDLNTLEFMK